MQGGKRNGLSGGDRPSYVQQLGGGEVDQRSNPSFGVCTWDASDGSVANRVRISIHAFDILATGVVDHIFGKGFKSGTGPVSRHFLAVAFPLTVLPVIRFEKNRIGGETVRRRPAVFACTVPCQTRKQHNVKIFGGF